MDNLKLTSIKATLQKPTDFHFEKENGTKEILFSSIPLIQSTLIQAYIAQAIVNVELVNDTKEIQRVFTFEGSDKYPYYPGGDYYVMKIGTQRNKITGKDHLEAFIYNKEGINIPCNLEDPLIQQLLQAAFLLGRKPNNQKYNLFLTFDKDDDKLITSASFGKKIV